MKNPYLTGVGPRKFSPAQQIEIVQIVFELAKLGYIWRTGGAEGFDSAVEVGVKAAKQIDPKITMESYIPWPGFNGKYTTDPDFRSPGYRPWAEQLAALVHPNWKACSDSVRKLHVRNVYQVMGEDAQTPSRALLTWTPSGKPEGGTGQAIRLAEAIGVPVFNLGIEGEKARFIEFIKLNHGKDLVREIPQNSTTKEIEHPQDQLPWD